MRIRKIKATRKVVLLAVLTFALWGVQGAFDTATAQFTPTIDHFKGYSVDPVPVTLNVDLIDQFGTGNVDLDQIDCFNGSVDKDTGGQGDPFDHHIWYRIASDPQPLRRVFVSNQFGVEEWQLFDGAYLLVPADKVLPNDGGAPSADIDHYKCYDAISSTLNEPHRLTDQFQDENPATIGAPLYFCNPVSKDGGDINHPNDHLACYDSSVTSLVTPVILDDLNFLVTRNLVTNDDTRILCVPSGKSVVPVPALSGPGVIAFLLLATGALFVVYRRRSRNMAV